MHEANRRYWDNSRAGEAERSPKKRHEERIADWRPACVVRTQEPDDITQPARLGADPDLSGPAGQTASTYAEVGYHAPTSELLAAAR